MEFMPTTTSGNAHRRYPFRSMTQENAARKKKQIPPLKSVQAGVQMRFTMGHMPVKCSARPAMARKAPAIRNRLMGIFGEAERKYSPARRPSSMVPVSYTHLRAHE